MFKELHSASLGQLPIQRLFSRPIGLLRARKYSTTLVFLTGLGLLLRLPLLAAFPFREDEAIYAFWALEAWHDPLFLHVWPDKPPIFIWLLSATFSLFGPSEASARALNISLSVLTIPVVAATARKLWEHQSEAQLLGCRRAGAVAALAVALNPFAISFAPTAFTDPLLVLAGSLAVYMAIRQRFFWAGLWLGVAIMTKQQGLLYAPLVIGFSVLDLRFTNTPSAVRIPRDSSPHERGEHRQMRALPLKLVLHFGIGLSLILLPILYWDSLRWAVAPSPWDLSIRNYGVLRLLPPSQWGTRIAEWSSLFWYLSASWAVWIWLAVASLGSLVKVLHKEHKVGTEDTEKSERESRPSRVQRKLYRMVAQRFLRGEGIKSSPFHPLPSSSPYLVILLAWSLAFLILHITTTIQPWDRYLLPLAPVLALLLGYLVSRAGRTLPTRQFAAMGATLFLLLFPPALKAANGQLPIGADHGAYAGLKEAVAWVQAEVALDEGHSSSSVLYHHVLGWHHQFYFADQVREDDVQLRWYPNSVYLLDNARKAPHLRKFLIQPAWAPNRDLKMRVSMSKLRLKKHAQFGNFSVLELSHSPQPICSWCLCRMHQ